MFFPALDQRLAALQGFTRGKTKTLGQSFVNVHRGHGNPSADADFVCGAAHLIRTRTARFQKAGCAATDHRGICTQAAAINIFWLETTFKRDEIALPDGFAQISHIAERRQLAAQELLRSVYMAIYQAGHCDHAARLQSVLRAEALRGFIALAEPNNLIASNCDSSVVQDNIRVVESQHFGSRSMSRSISVPGCSILSPLPDHIFDQV